MLAHFEQRLQQLQLYCRHKSNHLLSGHYHSAFKGHGMEFDEVRPYVLGDDVRTIDWNVTARTGEVHIKRFHEERELNLIFVVDHSPSFIWSSDKINRCYTATQFCGLLGSAALANNDRIGLLQFSDQVNEYLRPARGKSQLIRCLSKLLLPVRQVEHTSVNQVVKHLGELSIKRSIIVLISDFLTDENYQENLAILARKHQVLAIALDDAKEISLPSRGLFQLTDSENKQQTSIDFSNPATRNQFAKQMQQRIKQRSLQFSHSGVDLLRHTLGDDPIETLMGFFQTHRQRVEGETGG
ncbi:DUF58 domain-containing protein [Colwellia piezophila]|uniref:DUF58 domain-containing protein n=1 Tax=Colwellia piezophila TaxID=211668 RepID=UPI000374C451|nr:DUF58 domain-containing protein [Colwellia piezophila]